MKQPSVNIKNKRATFDYELMDTYTAGIVLTGTEIKSIRLGKASLVDTFCYFAKGELWVKNMHIAEYFYGSYNNHTARRDRKLLLMFFLGIGSEEHPERTKNLSDGLQAAGINTIYYESPGTAHEFLTWRRCLKEFVPLLFKTK